MAANKVPSLSAAGWLTELAERADALMAYYLTSEHSQSYIYRDNITSLPYHIKQHGANPSRLESVVETDLLTYFRRHFEDAEISASTDNPDPDDPERINLTLDCVIIENGKRYSLGREIRSEDNRVIEIFDTLKGAKV